MVEATPRTCGRAPGTQQSAMTSRILLPVLAFAIAAPAVAQRSPSPSASVSEARLRADLNILVGFGTRHTMSEQDNASRGIGAARRWAEQELRRVGAGCGGCIAVELPERVVTGERVPTPTRLVNVVGIQRGTERPNEVVIISAHIDSRGTDVLDARVEAPGANDNGSGTAAVLEAARVLSQRRYPTTIIYAVLSGEEQGLLGGRLLADWAKERGYVVKAVLNNDIIGGSRGSDGRVDSGSVRVFSEGPRADGTDASRAAGRREGGENDSPSRNLSRFIDTIAAHQRGLGLDVRQVWRSDRFGRGGDQLPMQDAGFPAVRLTVGIEDYDHQHQDLRTENGKFYGDVIAEMDFAYLARVTRLNIAALDALAKAPMPPAPRVRGAVSTDTTLEWPEVAGAAGYRIYQRATDARDWMPVARANGTARSHVLRGVRVDDWVFGVSAVSAAGAESPVASAVPGGAYVPLPRPATR